MESIDFCRQAYLSADKYYRYLQDAKLGKDVIHVTSIERIGVGKFRLSLSKKTMYIDSVEFKIDSPLMPFELQDDDISILEYNESHPYIIIRTSPLFTSIFENIRPQNVTLESDLSFLVKAVKKWQKKFHDRVALPSSDMIIPPIDISRPPYASDEQYEALRVTLTSPVSYVWGAPGTGKTQMVLTNAILYYADQKRVTLLLAPTNNALEQSLRGVITELDRQGRNHNAIIRLGRATTDFLLQFPEICESGSYDRLVESMQKDIDVLKKHREKQKRWHFLLSKNKEFEILLEQYNKHALNKNSIEEKIYALSESLQETKNQLEKKKEALGYTERQTQELRDKLQRQKRYLFIIPYYSSYAEILNRHNDEVRRLSAHISEWEGRHLEAKSAVDRCKQEYLERKMVFDKAARQYGLFRFKIKAFFSKKIREQAENNLRVLESRKNEASEAANEAEVHLGRIADQIRALNSEITQKENLLTNNPDLLEISREVFSKPYPVSELKLAFEEELAQFADFALDDDLEQRLRESEEKQDGITRDLQNDQTTSASLTQDLQEAEADLLLISTSLNESRAQIAELSAFVFKETVDNESLAKRFFEALQEYKGFEEIPDIDKQIEEKESGQAICLVEQKEVFKGRYIVACTVDYATLHYESLLNGADDIAHVFVDEAAYCSLAKSGVLFSFDAPVTFLGDHMQLPPICEMRKNNILRSVENHSIFMWDMSAIHLADIFCEQCTIDSLFERYCKNSEPEFYFAKKVFLTKTFRFGERLARILDKFIYNQGFYGETDAQTKIIVIDAKRGSGNEEIRESHSEAIAIQRYLALNAPKDFVILAPYKKQCRLIEEVAHLPKGSVLTVHAAQGREWETVILSVTDSFDRFFMNSKNHASGGAQIINTAVSRVKKNLVLVLDFEIWNELDGQMITELARSNDELYTFN